MSLLQNKCAVITGASSGIGRAITVELAKHSMHLCLLGRRKQELEMVASQLKTSGSKSQCYEVDLEKETQILTTIEFISDNKNIDVLIHSAGVIAMDTFETASIQDLDWQYKVNVRAPYLLTQAFTASLRKNKGQVVFINSSAGHTSNANVGQYAATKHALKALADSYRMEENRNGIRVLNVFPGRTASPMQEKIFQLEGRNYHESLLLQPSDIAESVVNTLLLPRTAEITDLHIRPMNK